MTWVCIRLDDLKANKDINNQACTSDLSNVLTHHQFTSTCIVNFIVVL